MNFYLLTETGDKILLEDGTGALILETVIPGPTVNYQGDGYTRRTRRRRFDELMASIERTLRGDVALTPLEVAPLTEAVESIDVSRGFDEALTQLTLLAREHQELSGRVESLRREVQEYEAKKYQELLEDDDEVLWLI